MFGMGFTEILIIAVIAILFLGPDKLPTAMVEVAKFFRNVKRTVGSVKDSLEQEMHVADIKEEALAYKKELLKASDDVKKATDIGSIGASLTNLNDDFLEAEEEIKEKKKVEPKEEKVTFDKKEESVDV
ncbi:MAG: Sec-independent protein translocase subunit TatB [Epsilonproteobacteria bacterium]|nr:Sec-independent protein translocase subunit TatB [Campylobacterota bacterium]